MAADLGTCIAVFSVLQVAQVTLQAEFHELLFPLLSPSWSLWLARLVRHLIGSHLPLYLLLSPKYKGGILLVRWRRQRALRAHRRKSSWMVSNKFKWPGDTKAPFEDTLRESEG
jgi:hypothetical protein